jgi:hypothetical protein
VAVDLEPAAARAGFRETSLRFFAMNKPHRPGTTVRHDAIMPLFCPTGQTPLRKIRIQVISGTWLLCMGLFSSFCFAGDPTRVTEAR